MSEKKDPPKPDAPPPAKPDPAAPPPAGKKKLTLDVEDVSEVLERKISP
jgi:hypothetical protein